MNSRWEDPESPWRLAIVVAVVAVATALFAVGFLTPTEVIDTTFAVMFVWIVAEWHIDHQARRDLTADLCKAVHDGDLDDQDLRRARGYWQIEDALERWVDS